MALPELRCEVEPVGNDPSKPRLSSEVIIVGTGLASLALYAILVLRHPLAVGLLRPRARWTPLVHQDWWAIAIHIGIYLLLTLAYVAAHRRLLATAVSQANASPRLLAWIAGIWGAASLLLLLGLTPNGESHDIYDYLFRGRMMAEAGANPLVEVPAAYASMPFYAYITWQEAVDTYGPLWESASFAVATVVRTVLQATGNWVAVPPPCAESAVGCTMLAGYVSGYRLLAVALTGLCGALIYLMVRRAAPKQAAAALLVWLWNPLLLIAGAGGAHNDLIMLACWAAALLAFQRRRWVLGLLALVLAAHVKLTALIVAPVLGLWLVRQVGWLRALARAALALLLAVPLSWLLYAPFGGWASLPRMLGERTALVANSLHHVAHRVLWAQGWDAASLWQATIFWPALLFLLLAVGLAGWMLGFGRRGWGRAVIALPDTTLWSTVLVVNLCYLLVGSFWFQFWYISWALLPAALLPAGHVARTIMPWLAFGGLSSNVLFNYLPLLRDEPLNRTQRVMAAVAAIWLPALVAWAARRLPAAQPADSTL